MKLNQFRFGYLFRNISHYLINNPQIYNLRYVSLLLFQHMRRFLTSDAISEPQYLELELGSSRILSTTCHIRD